MQFSSDVTAIKGVGPEIKNKLQIIGVQTVNDLINFYPRRYDDYSQISTIDSIEPGKVTVKAKLEKISGRYVKRAMHITEATAYDSTGRVKLVWFNQPYRAQSLKSNIDYFISGEFSLQSQRLSIMNPSLELAADLPVNTARVVPVYRETKGFKSSQVRKFMAELMPLIQLIDETLPSWIITEQKLMPRREAIMVIHFPTSPDSLAAARRRLGFEEVFELSLAALLNKYELMQDKSVALPFNRELAVKFVCHLPFELTMAQKKVVWQLYKDMQRQTPANRLIEGDVGSGKTVVAAMAALAPLHHKAQVAMMAPTELLARQHANTIYSLLQPLGLHENVGLLVGGMKPAQKAEAKSRIASGLTRFIIGTHALFQQGVDIPDLALVIVDEQHRFGVGQRKALQSKAGHMPHVVSMTATPIPRSLALTLYGEMDISIIDQKPAGRLPIKTSICSPNSRQTLNDAICQQLDSGRQMFTVCPLVSDSDVLAARSAESVYAEFATKTFKKYRVGLIHGKMKPADKESVMQAFAKAELDILVATTVIEVGVNVPNASIMLVENAERFGLAQIHQLRGRVGRSQYQGYCYLMMGDSSAPSRRLRALETCDNGFELAELDLEIRGPGAIYGTAQHGQLDLRVANLSDTRLIASARAMAQKFIDKNENLVQYKHLHTQVSKLRVITNLN